MYRQIRNFSICVLATFLFAPVAGAQLSSTYADWAEGPAGFLLTKKEKKEWKKISTDQAAESFIELFWAKRNPSPETSFNSYRAEFESVVEFCDETFAYGKRRGAFSDRAKVLILMGRPASRQVDGPAQTGPVRAGGADDSDTPSGSTEYWIYDPAQLAKEFSVKGSQLIFVFYEERLGSNAFVFDRSNRDAVKGMSALSKAPEVRLLHPNLKEVPTPVSFAGAKAASAASLAWLGQDAPFNDANRTVSELGVTDASNRPMWVHIELPPDAPTLDVVAGRVRTAGGEILSTFEIDAEPLEGQNGKAYHLAFPLEVGEYTIDVVGATGGKPQITASLAADIAPIPTEGTWMSPLWLGVSASPNEDANYGDPFTFGGWHMVPITGLKFTRQAEVVFFGFAVRPVVTEEETVDFKALIKVKMDGKPIGKPFTMELGGSQVLPGLWMYGNSIGLSSLPETGNYGIVFKITEGGSEAFVEREVELEVVE